MQYKYRWIHAIVITLVIFMLGFFYTLQPDLEQLANLRKREAHLVQRLAMHKKIIKQKIIKIDRMAKENSPSAQDARPHFLADIVALVHLHGLIIQSMKMVPLLSDAITLHLVLKGNFQQAMSFAFALSKPVYPAFILDFSYQVSEKNKVILTMKVLMLDGNRQIDDPQEILSPLHNPFCFGRSANELDSKNEENKRASTPLTQLKMVGYLQQDFRCQALILLPTNAVIAVVVGSILGLEHGNVIAVTKDHVVVELPDKRRRVIGMW
jgi:hypothetical protein